MIIMLLAGVLLGDDDDEEETVGSIPFLSTILLVTVLMKDLGDVTLALNVSLPSPLMMV